ncbi:MAG: leucine-rich repeat protein [Lachnospiraceae bacterium]|nr:leucine-rich repeat protein [Lachnospiraceae bacterium]
MQKKKKKRNRIVLMVVMLTLCMFPGTTVSARTDEVEINGVKYELDRAAGECEATLNVKKGRAEVVIPSEIVVNGKKYKVTFFSWDDWTQDWREELGRKYKPAPGSYQALLKKITIEKGVRVSEPACHYKNLEQIIFLDPCGVSGTEYYDCPKLKKLYIPKNVRYWPVVRKCANIKISIDKSNPYLKVIDNDIYSKNGKVLYSVASKKAHYKVRKSVRTIEDGAFYKNDYIKTIYLPDSVKNVGEEAFGDMKNLKSIRFGKSIRELDYALFNRSMKLKSVTLTKNIRIIRGEFGGKKECGIKKLYIHAASLKKCSFKTLSSKCRVFVKNDKVKKQIKKSGFKGKVTVSAKMR